MKTKLLFFGVLVALCLAVNVMFDVVVSQPVAATLAVQQVTDSETAATAVRSYQSFSNAVPLISWGSVVIAGLCMFGKDLARYFKL